MVNKDILEYVERNRSQYSLEALIEKLKAAGYPSEDIVDSLKGSGTKNSPRSILLGIVGAIVPLVIIGVFFIVLLGFF